MMTKPTLKHTLIPGALLLLTVPHVAAAQSPDSLSELFACEQIAGDAAQLACFRRVTAKMRDGNSRVDSAVLAEKDRLSVEAERQRLTAQKESLEAEQRRLSDERQRLSEARERAAQASAPAFNEDFNDKPEAPREQSVVITNVERIGGNGYSRFTLENGEVWVQTESAGLRLGRGDPDVLVIKKTRFGSFLGLVNDRRPSFRVKQVK